MEVAHGKESDAGSGVPALQVPGLSIGGILAAAIATAALIMTMHQGSVAYQNLGTMHASDHGESGMYLVVYIPIVLALSTFILKRSNSAALIYPYGRWVVIIADAVWIGVLLGFMLVGMVG